MIVEYATPSKLPEVTATSDILGIPFSLIGPSEVRDVLQGWVARGERRYVTLVNPHSVMCAQRNPAMRDALLGSGLNLPDGAGIGIASKILNYAQPARIPGTELMLDVCDWGRAAGLRHFFYGGGAGVAEQVAARLERDFPGLQIAGTLMPPFRQLSRAEDEKIVQQINATAPDIVWVALGTTKQECWMASHAGRINAAAMMGVGAAFDFLADRIQRAPLWMRRGGLEWAHRLTQEPLRLWRRNLDSPLFVWNVAAQRLSNRRTGASGPYRPLSVSDEASGARRLPAEAATRSAFTD